jgi:ribosome-binding protein aMBF1 (putative translation factor)
MKRAQADDLERYVGDRRASDAVFAALVEAAEGRERLLHALADARRRAGLTQTEVASRMGTSASTVARLERGDMNPTLATLERFSVAVGKRLRWRIA